MATVYNDDKAVMFGGAIGSFIWTNDTWIYDSSINDWTLKPSSIKPSARVFPRISGVYGTNKIILFGGQSSNSSIDNDTWIYDADINQWQNVTPTISPTDRKYHQLAPIYGTDKVLLFGGYNYSGHLDDTWIYDLSNNTWKRLFPIIKPSERAWYGLASIHGDDKVVLFGGWAFNGITEEENNETWIFDLSEERWTRKFPLRSPNKIDRIKMTSIYGDDTVFLFGGEDSAKKYDETWIYDLSENRWSQKKLINRPEARTLHSLATINGTDKILLFGGQDSDLNRINDTWLYKPFYTNGTFISRAHEIEKDAIIKTISWNSITPANTLIKFQVQTAGSNQSLSSKLFTGPDGLGSTFYTSSPSNIWIADKNHTWLQFKAYFISNDHNVAPQLLDVTISYNIRSIAQPKSPENNSIITSNKPIFNWTFNDSDSDSQAAFQLIIDDDITFTSIDFDSSEVSSNEQSWQITTPIDDGTWFWKVRTKDNDGDWSKYGEPFKFILDTTLPISKITFPVNNHFYRNIYTIEGQAFDAQDGSGIGEVQIYIQNLNDSTYWNGSDWISTKYWLTAYGLSNWTYNSNTIPWMSGISYEIRSWVLDNASNLGVMDPGVIFTIDRDEPKSTIDYPINDTWINNLDLITGQTNDDNGSGVRNVEISIFRPNGRTYWDGENWVTSITSFWFNTTGNSSWKYNTSNFDWWNGYEYNLRTRATDNVGNIEKPSQGILFKYDDNPPNNLTISINNDTEFSFKPLVFLSLSAKDDESEVNKMSFSLDNKIWSPWLEFNTSAHYKFPTGFVDRRLYYRVSDLAGNIAEPVYASISIIFDTDNDMVPDSNDSFPDDPAASVDTDGDRYPDQWNPGMNQSHSTTGLQLDAFPNNSSEWLDTDGDGVGDNSDAFPNDIAASIDSDNDTYPDKWNDGMSEKDSTTGLKKDHYPNDPNRWKKEEDPDSFFMFQILILIIVIILILLIGKLASFVSKKKRLRKKYPYLKDDSLREVRTEILIGKDQRVIEYTREDINKLLEARHQNGDISDETFAFINKEFLCAEGDEDSDVKFIEE